MYICPYCGNQLEGQPKFCHYCGNSLATQGQPVPAYQPPAPVYEPPAPVYEQPAPVYEQPAPVYEQPAYQYEQAAYQYEQPVPVYEQPVYEQPVYDYAYPVQDAVPETKPAKKSKTGLIVGIAAILVVVVLAVLFLPKLLGGNADSGNSGSNSVTPTDRNDPDTDGTEPAAVETKSPEATQLEGYWTLHRAESADPSNVMTEEEVQKMRETLDTELFLVLNGDGTGVGSFYSETRVTWGDGVLTMRDLGIKCMYTLEHGELTLVMDFDAGVKYIYVPGKGEAPELDMNVDTETEENIDDLTETE